jgi:DNA-binding response OmpR family regulator
VRRSYDLPIIVVSARADTNDIVAALEAGADDYVTKPFSPREVVARVKTVLRRSRLEAPGSTAQQPNPRLQFDGLVIDLDRREVTVADAEVQLSTLELDLLIALASSPGRVFSRAQLLEKVWGYDFYGDERVVDVHIRGMRKALGDDATSPRVIGTVRGVGYKFLLDPVDAAP